MIEEYEIDPLEHMLDLSKPPANINRLFATYPSINTMDYRDRIKKRWGYSAYRDMGSGVKTQHIVAFEKEDATKNIMILTETDLGLVETASGKTFSYKTETNLYIDGDSKGITDITGAVVTFDASATLQTDGLAAGDKFILDDDHTSDEEPDTNWGTVLTVDSETQLTLTATYAGTTGSFVGAPKDGRVRLVYSIPTDGRWQFALVDNQFFFTNGSVDLQYWDGTAAFASAVDSTNLKNARYCLEYANRLLIADYTVAGDRNPWALGYSEIGDPTDFTTAITGGRIDFAGTQDFITGLAKVGINIIVFKEDSFHQGYRTGDSKDPMTFPKERPGIGNFAPYSLTPFQGTCAFLWRNDFYVIEGTEPRAIGGRMAYDFFRLVEEANQKNCWGFNVQRESQICWVADTKDGRLGFVWDYKEDEWGIYNFWDDMVGGGGS